jgi:hypothetical protein
MLTPLILMSKSGIFLLLVVNIIYCVLDTLRDSLFDCSHIRICCNSELIHSVISLTSLPVKNKFVSSANNNGREEVTIFERSLMYNKNNKGPRIEP